MCVGGTPDVPTVAQRQDAKQPQSVAADSSGDARRRRLMYAASILTTPQGALGSPNTTANMKSVTGA